MVSELSPYELDLDWEDLTEPEEIEPVMVQLGRATAKLHCVGDADSDHTLVPFQTEEAITVKADLPGVEAESLETDGRDNLLTITARVKALKPGRYLFVNEYREDVAKGYVVAE